MRVWLDGALRDDPEAPALRVDDHGFTVGDGVFEAVKVVEGTPFALTRHLRRLAASAAAMRMAEPDEEEVRRAIAAVLDGTVKPLVRLRITYTAGPAPLGSGRGEGRPTLAVVAAPMRPSPATTRLRTVPWPRNERGVMAGVKTTSYAENVVALHYAHEHDADEAVFTTLTGNLCEGTGSNVFYVVGGEVRTPTLASGCLAGVTRSLLLAWAEIREVDEPVAVAEGAEEVFLASTTRDVQPVSRWNDRDIGAAGPVTKELQELWRVREAESADP